MTNKKMGKKYIVYVHIFPNGKKYDKIVFYNQRRLAEYMGGKTINCKCVDKRKKSNTKTLFRERI